MLGAQCLIIFTVTFDVIGYHGDVGFRESEEAGLDLVVINVRFTPST